MIIFMFNIIVVLFCGNVAVVMIVRSHESGRRSLSLICIFTNITVVLVNVFSFLYTDLFVCPLTCLCIPSLYFHLP